MSSELVPKYEEWVARLEENLVGLMRERRNARRLFIASLVIAPFGFFWSKWVATALILLLGVLLLCTTFYITEMRKYQYLAELEKTRAELDRMRG